MSRVLSVKNGIKYFKNQREKSNSQDKWDYYNDEIYRLEKKLYELQLIEELKEYESR